MAHLLGETHLSIKIVIVMRHVHKKMVYDDDSYEAWSSDEDTVHKKLYKPWSLEKDTVHNSYEPWSLEKDSSQK